MSAGFFQMISLFLIHEEFTKIAFTVSRKHLLRDKPLSRHLSRLGSKKSTKSYTVYAGLNEVLVEKEEVHELSQKKFAKVTFFSER